MSKVKITVPQGLGKDIGKTFFTCFASVVGTVVGGFVMSHLTDKALKASKPDITFGFTK